MRTKSYKIYVVTDINEIKRYCLYKFEIQSQSATGSERKVEKLNIYRVNIYREKMTILDLNLYSQFFYEHLFEFQTPFLVILYTTLIIFN